MPIQSKIIENPSKSSDFPKLMRLKKQYSREGFYVILFSEKNKGMIAASNDKYKLIGYYSNCWEMNCFEDFNGTVEMKNG